MTKRKYKYELTYVFDRAGLYNQVSTCIPTACHNSRVDSQVAADRRGMLVQPSLSDSGTRLVTRRSLASRDSPNGR